jgi:sugar phosphate isomerase/epimerase
MKACISFACWPGLDHEAAARHLAHPPVEPCFGELSTEHVQLVPQNLGRIDEALVDRLRVDWPESRFRLHANVRVLDHHVFADLSGYASHTEWFRRAACISRLLDAPAYTAHAGKRADASMAEMLDHARRCAELFGCPVGVEGHYPTRHDAWLLSSWAEYRALFESGVPYALDLSHLNILATWSGRRETALVAEMLACERCLEIHVSDNDGHGDGHLVCEAPPWWFDLLDGCHGGAVIFAEGNHRFPAGKHSAVI